MNKERDLLPVIERVRMATIYHFQPWTIKTSKNFVGSLLWPTKMFARLRKQEAIKPVVIYPYSGRTYRNDTFYSIKADSLSVRELHHQFGLTDVLMAFIYAYPDYDVEITHLPCLKVDGKIYKPDALVKLTDRNLKEYTFIIEFERSRNEEAIYKEKLLKNERMKSFKESGLSEHTKILYVYAYERFDVFWRPNQYELPNVLEAIDTQNRKFDRLINKARNLPDHKYRFLPLHKFSRLNEQVWTTPKGNRVSLI
jgi:hypothetical protein